MCDLVNLAFHELLSPEMLRAAPKTSREAGQKPQAVSWSDSSEGHSGRNFAADRRIPLAAAVMPRRTAGYKKRFCIETPANVGGRALDADPALVVAGT